MKFYLASRFERRKELQGYAQQLEKLGHTITARWLDPAFGHQITEGDQVSQAFNEQLATEDLEDIDNCSDFVVFMPGGSRGGMNVELGYAIALRRVFGNHPRIYVISGHTNVFTYLKFIYHYKDFEDFSINFQTR